MIGTQTGRRATRAPLDFSAILVAPLGIGVVVAAQTLAGVPVNSLLQYSAALIVFGGTLGALLVTYSVREVLVTLRAVAATFRRAHNDLTALGSTVITLAARAHRHGLVTIDGDAEAIEDSFLREGLAFAIDESSTSALREVLTAEAQARSAAEESPARVLEAAAGYAPTLGILGAVLGLIHALAHLGSPGTLGGGIAVAFVATVYGVGTANLILLPLAGRLRERAAAASQRRELMTVAICAIQQRTHPRVLARKLRSFGVKADATAYATMARAANSDIGHVPMAMPFAAVGAAGRDQQALA